MNATASSNELNGSLSPLTTCSMRPCTTLRRKSLPVRT